MAVTDDFTNFYVEISGAGSSPWNGGSSKGAPKVDSTFLNNINATSGVSPSGYNLENMDNDGWGTTAIDDWLCWDVDVAREFARVSATGVGGDADVITVIKPGAPLTTGNGKGVNVGGAWALISNATSRLTVLFVNASGLPPKVWIKAGTYDAETGSTGFIYLTADGTASIPLSLEGYTTTEGDGDDDCVVINAAGSGKHGVYVNVDYWRLRFMRSETDANSKNGFSCGTGQTGGIWEDLSATATGNSTSRGFYLYNAITVMRLRATGCDAEGIDDDGGCGTIAHCRIDDCLIGISRSGGARGAIIGCVISNTASHGISIATDTSFSAIDGCTFYGIAGDAISCIQPTYLQLMVSNCIFENINGEAIDAAGNTVAHVSYCAFYDCGSGGNAYFDPNIINQATLLDAISSHNVFQTSGTFFTNAAAGDFSLNDIDGQGKLIRGSGYPTGRDIGALQSIFPTDAEIASGVWSYANRTLTS